MPHQLKEGEWQEDLCDCCSSGNVWEGLCCPCLMVQKTQNLLEKPNLQGKPDSCGTTCLAYTVLQYSCGFGFLVEWSQRRAIRGKYGISSGNKCTDCATPFFCPCCAVIQEYTEVKRQKEAGEIKTAYQGEAPMQMGH